MTKPTKLSIDLLRTDGETQSRISINEDAVDDYSQVIAGTAPPEWPFPPVDAFHDGTDYFVADGFHRVLGAARAKRASIPCVIHKGTARDAKIFGMTANDRHGLRVTRADKRACVEWLLDGPERLTQTKIAELVGVSKRTVQGIVAERNPRTVSGKTPPKRDGKAQIAPSTPIRGGSEPIGESTEATDSDDPDQPKTLEACPNCGRNEWLEYEDGKLDCIGCKHPYGDNSGCEATKEIVAPPAKLGKQFSRADHFRTYDQAVGPLCRLVDKIARSIGESSCERHNQIQRHLNAATEEMMEWMGVQK